MPQDEEYADWVVVPPHDKDEEDPDRINQGDDSDSGSSSGGSSSSGSSSGSDSGGSSGSGDSSSVVVTGDPGSEEGQTVVGQGDSLEEARTDAAANPEFDAAEGSDIDDIEERIGADGAADKDSTSVVVTGGAGSGKPQKTVGTGSTTLQARKDAARNLRFDAAQGEAVDAVESLQSGGLGDGTKIRKILQEKRGRKEERRDAVIENKDKDRKDFSGDKNQTTSGIFDEAKKEFIESQTGNEFVINDRKLPGETATGVINKDSKTDVILTGDSINIPTPGQPETPAFKQDARGDESDLFGLLPGGTTEESLETSVQIFNTANEAGETVTGSLQGLKDTSLSDLGITENRIERVSNVQIDDESIVENILDRSIVKSSPANSNSGNAVSKTFSLVDETVEGVETGGLDLRDTTNILTGSSDAESRKQSELAGAAVKELAEVPGLIVGAPGAFGELAEDNTSVSKALSGGASLTVEAANEDPDKFLTQELGGEALGVISPGFSLVPDAVSAPESVARPASKASRFARGDLGTRATDTRAEINLEETDVLRRGFEDAPGDRDGRIQFVEGRRFTEGGTELSTGQGVRVEKPVSRRGFVKESLGLKDKTISEALRTSRKGQSGLSRSKSSKNDVLDSDSTGKDFEPDDVFKDSRDSGIDNNIDSPSSISTPEGLQEQDLGQGSGLEDELNLDQQQENVPEEKPPENPPKIIEEQKPESDSKVFGESDILVEDDRPPERIIEGEGRVFDGNKARSSDILEQEDKNDDDSSIFSTATKDTEFQGSVGAEILGVTAEERPGRLQASDPTNLRPILEDNSSEDDERVL